MADDRALAAWEAGANLPRRSYTRPLPKPAAAPKPEPKPAAEFLTAHEVAALLGVSPMTVYRAIDGKHLKAHRILRSYRIHRDDFEAWLNGTATA
jgi:excisionase family DNA binding protein